jgi:hypothetical protein
MFKLSGMLFPFALGQYNSPENEFKFIVNNYDTLNAHANKCTIIAEYSTSVVYCEDGYVAVDQSFEFIGSSGAYNKATSAMDLGDQGPRDVRVGDTYLSMTDGAGTYLNVIRT